MGQVAGVVQYDGTMGDQWWLYASICKMARWSSRIKSDGESRMFSHITVGTNDLDQAAAFYDAILIPLGLRRRVVTPDGGPPSACWVKPDSVLPRFYVYSPYDRNDAGAGNGSMVAFTAPFPNAVDTAYAAGLLAGGSDEGEPGQRPQYGDGYYGAYLRDPDGNKVHIAHRGDLYLPG
jgi:catechol 2,3-dioxygenase-like lactoylglutathione lyase family enzyme